MSEFRVLLSFYPEGIGPKVKKFELLTIASKNKRHFIRIRSEKDLDKAIERAVDTSIGKLIILIKQLKVNNLTSFCVLATSGQTHGMLSS